MYKIHEKSSFEYCRADCLDTLQVQGRVILQIEQCERIDEGLKQMVIVETVCQTDYEKTTTETQIYEAYERAEEAQARSEAFEEMLEQQRDWTRKKEVEIIRIGEENQKLYEALVECRRIFGTLPTEIEQLLGGDLNNVYAGTV